MQKQPAVQHGREEKDIGKGGVFWSQGTKKTVEASKDDAGKARVEKPLGGKLWCGHRIRRLNQPPAGRGSS